MTIIPDLETKLKCMNISTATDYIFFSFYRAIVNYNCVCMYATYDELLTYFNQLLAHFPEKYAKVWNTSHKLKQIYMTQEQ